MCENTVPTEILKPPIITIRILTSIQDDFGYYNNLAYLQIGLQQGSIQFQGAVSNYTPKEIVIDNKGRIYDFTRSACRTVREDMTTYLGGVLPALTPRSVQLPF